MTERDYLEDIKEYCNQFRDIIISKDDMLNIIIDKCVELQRNDVDDRPYVYIAGRKESAKEFSDTFKDFRDTLVCTSSWFFAEEDGLNKNEIVEECQNAIVHSDVFVMVHDSNERSLQGTLVEMGIALEAGIPVVVATNQYELVSDSYSQEDETALSDFVYHSGVHCICPTLSDALVYVDNHIWT